MRPLIAALALMLAACSQGEPSASAEEVARAQPSPVERCMNLGGALEAPNEGDWGYTVRQAVLVRLKEAGFDESMVYKF